MELQKSEAIECAGPKTRPSLTSGAQTWRTKTRTSPISSTCSWWKPFDVAAKPYPNFSFRVTLSSSPADVKSFLISVQRVPETSDEGSMRASGAKHNRRYVRSRDCGLAASFYSAIYINHKKISKKIYCGVILLSVVVAINSPCGAVAPIDGNPKGIGLPDDGFGRGRPSIILFLELARTPPRKISTTTVTVSEAVWRHARVIPSHTLLPQGIYC